VALNGRFPDSLLAYLGWPEADHLRLVPAAAESITRLAAAFEAEFHKPLYLSDAYRTYAQQVTLKATKGKFAATPGTSNHGLGLAIDAASRINVDGSAEHRWMEANAPAYGWVNPWWAQDYNSNNGQHEPWHWEYHFDLDTRPSPALAQEDDMPLNAADATLINSVVINVLRSPEAKGIIRDAVLATKPEGGSTVWQTLRDARTIARRAEIAVLALPTPGTPSVGTVDYAALAKAVNDDAARRLAS